MIGAVLAGGKAKRFGSNKLFFKIHGKPLIVYTIEKLEIVDEIDKIVIITAPDNKKDLEQIGYDVVIDKYLIGPIGGVYTALNIDDAFVVGGDMPLLVPQFIKYMIDKFFKSKEIICVPRWENSNYIEPLHAVYSKDFKKILKEKISRKEYALNQAIRNSNACYVSIEKLPGNWKKSLFNVNTKCDIKKLKF